MSTYKINLKEQTATSINPHLFEVSRLHSAYINKMGYEGSLITHCIYWYAW